MAQKSGFVSEDGSGFVPHHKSTPADVCVADTVGNFLTDPFSFIDRGEYASLIVPFLDKDRVVMIKNIDHHDPRLKFPCGEKAVSDGDSPLCTAGRESLEEFLKGGTGDGRDWDELEHHERLALMGRFVPILAHPQRSHVRYVHGILLGEADELLEMGREDGVNEKVFIESLSNIDRHAVLWGHADYGMRARDILFPT